MASNKEWKTLDSPASYTVSWIAALHFERAAAIVMLDERHNEPKAFMQNESDTNSYAWGRIGYHNIVIASLPSGEYGTVPAANTANGICASLPHIRIGLFVGIGAGIGAKSQVLLGDVVVSNPTNTNGGVVQYDLYKSREGIGSAQKRTYAGMKERIGFLNSPPLVLRNALTALRAEHEISGSLIHKRLDAFRNNENMQQPYSFPGADKDRLRQGVPDTRLLPEIHYGTIASGNTLIKNASERDSLIKWMRTDNVHPLCFEMEAAGLMNNFPCLVIRGICDYADEHKNDDWQRYATATAAVFAKELLEYISARQIEETDPIGNVAEEVRDLRLEIKEGFSNVQKQQISDSMSVQQRSLFKALKTCNYEGFKNMNPEKAPNTCSWVLQHKRYREWSESQYSDLLWITADPGCGKSVLAKAFVDDPNFSIYKNRVTCYFFFKDNEKQNKLEIALCALLHQLFSQLPGLLDFAKDAWNEHGTKLCTDVDKLWSIFCNAATATKTEHVLCVLDALDECQDDDRNKLLRLLRSLYQTSMQKSQGQFSILKLIVTSRPYDTLESILNFNAGIRLRGEDENESIGAEINNVVQQRVYDLALDLSLSEGTQRRLEQKLLSMRHRTYLWLFLATKHIREQFKKAWNHDEVVIDAIPDSVQQAYENILRSIAEPGEDKARRVLGIVANARRPLTVAELRYALQFSYSSDTEDVSTVTITVDLKAWIRDQCGLFIYFNDGKAYLIHQTAKEFIIQGQESLSAVWTRSFSYSEIEELMASICIKALCSDLPEVDRIERSQNPESSFAQYCAEFWLSHSRDVYYKLQPVFSAKIDALHKIESVKFEYWFEIYWRQTFKYEYVPEMTTCRLCAFTGHVNWFDQVSIQRGEILEATDERGRSALYWACERGNLNVVRKLLPKCKGVNAKGRNFVYALQAASFQGHIEIVKLLLDNGADVNAKGGNFGNALQAASFQGHIEIVKLLLDNGADVNAKGGNYGNALQTASFQGHIEISKLLLENGANVNATGGHYDNALYFASFQGYIEIVKLLLDNGADVNATGGLYGNALQTASFEGHIEIVKLLLENGADVNASGGYYGNALQTASYRGHIQISKLLLENGADVNARGGHYGSALQAASYGGYIEILKLLLENGADVNAKGDNFDSALQAASYAGHIEIVRLLLENGARKC